MNVRILHIIFMMNFVLLSNLFAQISPGDLTKAHADLEGIRNCTQCHDLGAKVSNTKCLDCHSEIKDRVDLGQGYHASKEVKGKDCATCHSEHHGKNFDMLRFNQDDFDHNLTGYELTGAHQVIDCRECHVPEYIIDRELQQRANTFLGLSQECVDCHTDVHQNTLSQDCASCHNTDDFVPASLFDHADTEFALKGKHQDVECIECHQKEIRDGVEFQRFAGVEFAQCTSCHEDIHDGNLGNDCRSCHNEDSFTSHRRLKRFDHNTTNFPLRGSHQSVDCADCHNLEVKPAVVFQDLMGTVVDDCIACHEDVHDNKFGSNCAKCHNEESFLTVSMDHFDHNQTDFPLRGKHDAVDCRECHTEDYTEPLPHNTCATCHSDYHEGEFAVNGVSPDCAECHTEDGFEVSLFTIEDHQETVFPLEGAHLATPCFACHLRETDDKWHFRQIGERCVDCHEDVHAGYISEVYYPNQDCQQCHASESWLQPIDFDHNQTDFALLGVHATTECMACHVADEANGENRYQGFVDLSMECATCHENIHEEQFAIEGITDCARCHGFETWDVSDFNHDNTAFPLEGRHAEVECAACHKEVEVNGKIITQYKFESFECVVCHQ